MGTGQTRATPPILIDDNKVTTPSFLATTKVLITDHLNEFTQESPNPHALRAALNKTSHIIISSNEMKLNRATLISLIRETMRMGYEKRSLMWQVPKYLQCPKGVPKHVNPN